MNSIYVADGKCIFHDPGPEMIPVFTDLDPGFRVESIQPGKEFTPKFQSLRKQDIILGNSPFEYSVKDLMESLYGKVMKGKGDRYSALDILYVLSLKALNSCSFCGWNCQVNRFNKEKGKCGLSSLVYASYPFTHIAEEAPINPSFVTNFGGCAMPVHTNAEPVHVLFHYS